MNKKTICRQPIIVSHKMMLYIIMFLMMGIFTSSASAQHNSDTTSFYYLLDTIKTPVKDKMWLIHREGRYTFYYINCPCLENDQRLDLYAKTPTTHFRISKQKLKSIKTVALYDLIKHLKACYLNPEKTPTYIYIIQPANGEFEATKVRLDIPNRTDIVY